MIIGIDPGASLKVESTGYATFSEEGDLVDFGQILAEDLPGLLKTIQPTVIVCENYRNLPWKPKAQNWSDNKASKVIGMCEMWCAINPPCKLELQDAPAKNMGIMWSGVKVPKDHSVSHQVMAYAHGVYYLVRNGIRTVLSYHQNKEKVPGQ